MSLTIFRPSIPVPLPLSRGGLEATTAAGGRATLELGDLAQLTAPGGTSTFLRADKTWAVPAGGGGGAPTDAEYITSTTNATLSAERVLTDTATITWDRATAGQIKANAIGGGGYTDEQAQDAVGAMLLDTATIDLTYTDATPSLSASVIDASITEAKLSLSDVTTKDATTSMHGLLRKLSGTATQYLDGSGAWTTPAGGGDTLWTRTTAPSSLLSSLVAYWKLEEATGNRTDSHGTNTLTDMGGVGQATGLLGQAASFAGGATNYLRIADNAALSMGDIDFTLAGWFYLANTSGTKVLLSKGNDAGSAGATAYSIQVVNTQIQTLIGNGSSRVIVTASPTLAATTWYLVCVWHDSVANTVNISVNNGAAVSSAWSSGCFDDAFELCLGRYANFNGGLWNGRIDSVGIWKRVLTSPERAALYNAGAGLEYPFTTGGAMVLQPATTTDGLLLGAGASSPEKLEVDGALKLGNALGTTDGTLRWSGTDFEGRKGGAWVSFTTDSGSPFLLMGA